MRAIQEAAERATINISRIFAQRHASAMSNEQAINGQIRPPIVAQNGVHENRPTTSRNDHSYSRDPSNTPTLSLSSTLSSSTIPARRSAYGQSPLNKPMVKRLVEEYAKWSIRNPNRLGGFKLLLEQVNIILANNGEFVPNLGPNLRTKVFRAKKILQQGLGPQLHMSMSPQLAGSLGSATDQQRGFLGQSTAGTSTPMPIAEVNNQIAELIRSRRIREEQLLAQFGGSQGQEMAQGGSASTQDFGDDDEHMEEEHSERKDNNDENESLGSGFDGPDEVVKGEEDEDKDDESGADHEETAAEERALADLQQLSPQELAFLEGDHSAEEQDGGDEGRAVGEEEEEMGEDATEEGSLHAGEEGTSASDEADHREEAIAPANSNVNFFALQMARKSRPFNKPAPEQNRGWKRKFQKVPNWKPANLPKLMRKPDWKAVVKVNNHLLIDVIYNVDPFQEDQGGKEEEEEAMHLLLTSLVEEQQKTGSDDGDEGQEQKPSTSIQAPQAFCSHAKLCPVRVYLKDIKNPVKRKPSSMVLSQNGRKGGHRDRVEAAKHADRLMTMILLKEE